MKYIISTKAGDKILVDIVDFDLLYKDISTLMVSTAENNIFFLGNIALNISELCAIYPQLSDSSK